VLYRVRIGEDEYLGSAEEVVAFMARAEGAPGHDIVSYMSGVAERLRSEMQVTSIDTTDPAAFLDSLDEHGIVPIETLAEPSPDRVDPDEALGDGLVGLGEGVDPDDIDEL